MTIPDDIEIGLDSTKWDWVLTPQPRTIWTWWVFGRKSRFSIGLTDEVTWLARFTTRMLLRSEWDRLV